MSIKIFIRVCIVSENSERLKGASLMALNAKETISKCCSPKIIDGSKCKQIDFYENMLALQKNIMFESG